MSEGFRGHSKRRTIPRSGFFLYLRVVRGLSIIYSINLTGSLRRYPSTPVSRAAKRYFDAWRTFHWLVEEPVDEPALERFVGV